jgi:hypothetical protein
VALEQALRDVWQVLQAHDPYKDWNKDPELKRALAETLMALADTGVVDPEELRSRALESLSFVRRSSLHEHRDVEKGSRPKPTPTGHLLTRVPELRHPSFVSRIRHRDKIQQPACIDPKFTVDALKLSPRISHAH